jgi:hypothetical protein
MDGFGYNMKTFPIRRIRCGVEPSYGWVTVWYNAGGRSLDVLHIVCDPEDDRNYMEGDDQMVAAWGGAKRILVRESAIELDLTKKAAKRLYLEPAFTLSVSDGLSGWKKARKMLKEMAGCSSGGCIKFAESGAKSDRTRK